MKLNCNERESFLFEQYKYKEKIDKLIDSNYLDEAEKELYEYNSRFKIESSFYLIKANLQIKRKQLEIALDTIQNGLFIYPKCFSLLSLLGYVYERQGCLLEANDAYIRALRQAGGEDDIYSTRKNISRISDIIKGTSFSKADYAKSLYKVVSVYCYGRSGTHFFKSLLDNHPETIVTMLNGIKILNLWDSEIKDKINDLSYEYIIDKIFEVLHTEFNDGKVYNEPKLNGMYVMGENRNEFYCINRAKFKQEFINIIKGYDSLDARFFYQAVQLAASYALGRNYDFTKGIPVIIEGGIHFSTYANLTQQLLNVFPYTKFIHMIRKPTESVASTVRSLAKSGLGDINLLCSNLVILLHRVPVSVDWVSRTYLIKLEDLHTKSRETLQLVCDHLDISWNDHLFESTFGGIKWWNTITSEVVSGFNTITISKTHDDVLSSFDKFRLECLLRVKYKAWGYESFNFFDFETLKKLFEYPFKFEKLYAKSEDEYNLNRRIICRNFLKYLKEENSLGDIDRYEYNVKLLSPGIDNELANCT